MGNDQSGPRNIDAHHSQNTRGNGIGYPFKATVKMTPIIATAQIGAAGYPMRVTDLVPVCSTLFS